MSVTVEQKDLNGSLTLVELLEKYNVVIPRIQRDYAQGRKGRERVRKNILKNIHDRINKGNNGDAPLTMDYVYGELEGKTLYPLDGQQRLTTLWLVHWYVLFRSYVEEFETSFKEELEKKVKKVYKADFKSLKKFVYQTRESSEEFIEQLCDMEHINDIRRSFLEGKKHDKTIRVSEIIKSIICFSSNWMDDPTIDALLRTLGGDGKSSDDCIEFFFYDHSKYIDSKELLFRNRVICFALETIGNKELPMESADDLYIRMNARGKLLSDFENLKADLISWMNSEDSDPRFSEELIWRGCKYTWKDYYALCLDNNWTNVFWNKVKEMKNPDYDSLFFSFVNRVVLNGMCFETYSVKQDSEDELEDDSIDTDGDNESERFYWAAETFSKGIEKLNLGNEIRKDFDKLYGAKLYGKSPDDSKVVYDGFENYRSHICFDTMKLMDCVFIVLNNSQAFQVIEDTFTSINKDYSFIPHYHPEGDNDVLNKTEMKERVYFYATCSFLEWSIREERDFNFSKEWIAKYKRWMRVVHNLVRNYYFANVSDMVRCIRFIRDLSDETAVYDYCIYKYLSVDKDNIKKKASNVGDVRIERFNDQLYEEAEKAYQILNGKTREDGVSWEEVIIEAEEYSFFDGTIRFLFTDANGDVDSGIWRDFDIKYQKAKTLFEPGQFDKREDDESIDKFSKPLSVLKEFLWLFNDFSDINNKCIFTEIGYDDRLVNWKINILCDSAFHKQVDMLLKGEVNGDEKNERYKNEVSNTMNLRKRFWGKRKYEIVISSEGNPEWKIKDARNRKPEPII